MFNHFNTPYQGMQLIPSGFHHILIHNLPKQPQMAVDSCATPRTHPIIRAVLRSTFVTKAPESDCLTQDFLRYNF